MTPDFDKPLSSPPAELSGAEGAGGGSATEPKTRKKGRPKKDNQNQEPTLRLPEGCTLSPEVDIPVDQLETTQDRDNNDPDKKELKEMGLSMRLIGQIYAIIVWLNLATGKYLVVAGNRRAAAARLVGIPTLRAQVIEGPANAIWNVISAVENYHRKQESPYSLAKKIQAAAKAGYDRKQLQELFNKSKGAISDMLLALKLPRTFAKRVETGENLYKVVAEYRKSIAHSKGEPTQIDSPRTTQQQADKDGTEPKDTPVTTDEEAAPPAALIVDTEGGETPQTIASDPEPVLDGQYLYGQFEHNGITIAISSATKDNLTAQEVIVALRHVLNTLEAKASVVQAV